MSDIITTSPYSFLKFLSCRDEQENRNIDNIRQYEQKFY